MSGINLKSHYTAQEIAFMRLSGLPGTRPGVSVRAKNEGWSSRPRSGQGGDYEYALDSMPSDIQNKIREYYYNALLQQQPVKAPAVAKTTASSSQLLEIVRQCPAVLDQKTAELTQKQRDIADARMVLAVEVMRLEDTGLSRIKEINFICDRSRSSDLAEHLQKYVDLANARKGRRVGVSVRGVNQWVVDYLRAKNSSERLALLAPGHKKAKQPEQVAWVPMFMAHYRNPNGPTVAEAYKDFYAEWMHHYADQPAMRDAIPSIHAVYRVMDKMPKLYASEAVLLVLPCSPCRPTLNAIGQ